MKILLFGPSQTILQSQGEMGFCPPLGLASIASYLSLKGWDVKIVDCYVEGFGNVSYHNGYKRIGLRENQITRYIQSYKPNIIGIGCNFTNFSRDLFELAKVCKQCNPCVPVIAGGAHPTMDAMNVINDKNIDIVVRGEGEKTLEEICERYIQGKSLVFTLGTVSKHNQEVVLNPLRDPIDPLDELPMPSYKHLKMEIYLKDQIKNKRVPFARRIPMGFIVSGRGCPYDCIFCSTSKVFRKFRTHSPSYVVKEIKYLISEYGVREIAFLDDCFTGDIKRVEGICDKLIEEKITIPWTVPEGLVVGTITEQFLSKMKRSGFYRACFPVETGCPEVAKYIGKPINLERAKETIAKCNRLGIYTVGNFIIGFPYETKEQIEETIKYALDSELDMISVYICQPHAGSGIYNIFKKENWLAEGDNTGSNYFFTKYNTKYFKAEELNKIREEFLTSFIKKRIYSILTLKGLYTHILSKINSLLDLLYFLRISLKFAEASIKKRKLAFFNR